VDSRQFNSICILILILMVMGEIELREQPMSIGKGGSLFALGDHAKRCSTRLDAAD
jgi:hypothetical protein